MMQTQSEIKEHARAFVLWREAKAVDWKCSVAELARACGMDRSTVGYLAKRRGWPLLNGNELQMGNNGGVTPLDRIMS